MKEEVNQKIPVPNPFLYRLVAGAFNFLVRTLTKFTVVNPENFEKEQRVLFVINHLHYFDSPAVITAAYPRFARPIVARKYQKHIFGWLMHACGGIFLNREGVDRTALMTAIDTLKQDLAVAIAIEGTRSKTGGLQEGKIGAAYMASRANAAIVPVAIVGTEKVVPAWFRLRRAEVKVIAGEPFWLEEGRHRSDKLKELTEEIMMTLARMLPEENRGIYTEKVAAEKAVAAGE